MNILLKKSSRMRSVRIHFLKTPIKFRLPDSEPLSMDIHDRSLGHRRYNGGVSPVMQRERERARKVAEDLDQIADLEATDLFNE